ncbi:MAG: hypothetical protein WA624_09965 [Methylocella sp.]
MTIRKTTLAAAFALASIGPAHAEGRRRQENAVAKQADAWFENYKFRDGESIPRLRIHYATLGTPHRNDQGDIDN